MRVVVLKRRNYTLLFFAFDMTDRTIDRDCGESNKYMREYARLTVRVYFYKSQSERKFLYLYKRKPHVLSVGAVVAAAVLFNAFIQLDSMSRFFFHPHHHHHRCLLFFFFSLLISD